MNNYLITKLLAVHLLVIAFAMGVIWLAIDTLAANYFVTLMEKYHISPEPAHAMFVQAVHRYLLWALLGAILLAIGLSFFMMRRILKPLTEMTAITRLIAAGDFSASVPVGSRDEVGQLARAFNAMAQSLKNIENLRRNLMIDVAHELRTPLTNIRGYLEALKDGVVPPSRETLVMLNQEALRLGRLVNDVLDLAKADAAHGQLRLAPVDLKACLDGILATFRKALADKAITLSLHAPEQPFMLQADRQRITRVLRNLVDNAVRYTPHDGRIDIHIRQNRSDLTMDFINPTMDLAPEDLPYLFERFYRGEKSRSREHGGAGIGLAMVKELVAAHGGSVGAAIIDDRVRFRLTLPTSARPHLS